MNALPWITALALLLYAGACLYLYKAQERLLYPGDGLPFGPFDALKALGGEAVTAELDGQALRYYRVPPSPGAGPAKGWILLFHGNRDGARERFDFAEHWSAWGYGSLLAEYPGYAGDPVRASQKILLRNGLAMADEAARVAQSLPLFFMGESLGTGVATHLAMRRPGARGLLLSTPYTSLAAVAQSRYPWMPVLPLIRDKMPAARWAPHVRCPVFIVHGTHDHTVPFKQGRLQSARFPAAPAFVAIEGPGHSDIRDRFPELYWGGIRDFLARCLQP